MAETGETNEPAAVGALLLGLLPPAVALLLYLPAARFSFVWDDWSLVDIAAYDSAPLTSLLTTTAGGLAYLPMAHLSLRLDTAIFGPWAGGFHLTSALIFAASTLLATRFYRALFDTVQDPQIARRAPVLASLCGLVFASHPLQVESTAFIAARGGLLMLLFVLASLLSYERFTRGRSRGSYIASLGFTAAALLSKQSAVALPALLLVVDMHRSRGISLRERLLPLLPHAVLCGAVALLHLAVGRQQGTVGSLGSPLELLARLPRAGFAFQFYVRQFLWPTQLTIEYDLKSFLDSPGLLALSTLTAFAGAAWFLLATASRQNSGRTFLLFYAAALLPVANLLPTSPAVADRYAQLPIVALVPLAVVTVARHLGGRTLLVAGALLLATLSTASHRQLEVWRDDQTLFAHALGVNPRGAAALGNLGLQLWDRGRAQESLRVLEQLHRLRPSDFRYHYVLGLKAEREGKLAEAERWFTSASGARGQLLFFPHMKLGDVYARQGRRQEARREYERALDLVHESPLSSVYRYELKKQLRLLGGPQRN